jgi:hypothetical protein
MTRNKPWSLSADQCKMYRKILYDRRRIYTKAMERGDVEKAAMQVAIMQSYVQVMVYHGADAVYYEGILPKEQAL